MQDSQTISRVNERAVPARDALDEDCPNYQANGNASAFGSDGWDLGFPLILIGWMTAVVVEQAVSATRRSAGRAAAAILLSVIGSCWLFANVAVVCR
ncbi:hypothetical protein KZZ52_25765 [Dactylosporangium sp. AC04546]|uniref:hypothetical protein n=1 Tax=Dactylosporangium sp. AC04546 TaxID=2862460 RepID=UPI001EDD1500|nr:hypothetical protein [Dactylosporangium sp. AC04546]WVK88679.1 hypothetical protein KZZ52_25765 [Dactylosporangium sp. AC04546]